MLATDDLQFGGPFAEWCRIAEDEGFECALADPFTGTYAEEEFRVYWHPEGLLMIGETFHWGEGAAKPSLNSSRLFFNWAHQTEPYDLGLHLSGCSLRLGNTEDGQQRTIMRREDANGRTSTADIRDVEGAEAPQGFSVLGEVSSGRAARHCCGKGGRFHRAVLARARPAARGRILGSDMG